MRWVVAVLLLVILPWPAQAWNAYGHMVAAALAYRQMSKEQRIRVSEMLRSHPEFSAWKKSYDAGSRDVPWEAFLMMKASCWPDEIRDDDSGESKPSWHYMNYPLTPPKFALAPSISKGEDILFALKTTQRSLADKKVPPVLRAKHLSWVIHLAADIHQPLHCVAWVDKRFPRGDRGGNAFYVKPGDKAVRLHGYWDGVLGRSSNPRQAWNEAIRLQSRFSGITKASAGDGDAKEWSLESRRLAIERVYLSGKLKGGANEQTAVKLPKSYGPNARETGERQLVLAGARLAALLPGDK